MQLEAGPATVVIDPDAGGRIVSLLVGGHELLVTEGHGPMAWGSFPMIPWAGRIRHGRFSFEGDAIDLPLDMPPHAIHGTTHRRTWEQVDEATITCELGPDWPWPGRAVQRFALDATGLGSTIEVHADADPMPVTVGWHPWFRRDLGGGPVSLDLPAARMWRRDAEGIPDGTLVPPPEGPWDDCFTGVAWPLRLRWPGSLSLDISADCDHLVVYDEPPHAVCVEPQSGPPDAHNSGVDLVVVRPDAPLVHTTTWRWQLVHPRST